MQVPKYSNLIAKVEAWVQRPFETIGALIQYQGSSSRAAKPLGQGRHIFGSRGWGHEIQVIRGNTVISEENRVKSAVLWVINFDMS
jgi:hypothetical protein